MWLTGFDAPALHTIYPDKPMRGHGLTQAIAHVNRVDKDKPGGVIVDYPGVAHQLKAALTHYTEGDRKTTGIDTAEAIAVLQEKLEVLAVMFHGFELAGVGRGPSDLVPGGCLIWFTIPPTSAGTDVPRRGEWTHGPVRGRQGTW